jgi:hypothetical protein
MNPKLTDSHSTGAASKLWRLAHFIRDSISQAKSQGKLVKTNETYVRNRVDKLEYKENALVSWQMTQEYFQKEEWHWRNQHEFVQNFIQKSELFNECVDELKKFLVHSQNNHSKILLRFLML